MTALALLCTLALSAPSLSPSADQFDQKHSAKTLFNGKTIVFVGGDTHETGQMIFEWGKALQAKLPAGVRVVGVANLKRLPFFVPKSAVKSGTKEKNPNTTILMDWDGVAFKELGFRGGIIEVRVYNRAGDLQGNVTGSATDTRVKMALDLVQAVQTSSTS